MKVFKTIFLCVVLVFALAGCGNSHAEADKTVKQGVDRRQMEQLMLQRNQRKGQPNLQRKVCR